MPKKFCVFILTLITIATTSPILAGAADSPISRREAFLFLWQSIKRPAQDTKEPPFADVPKDAPGFLEITYAKKRGMIEDGTHFYPDEPLDLETALYWMFQTRNVFEYRRITHENFDLLLERYPVLEGFDMQGKSRTDRLLTRSEFEHLAMRFKQLMDTEVQLITYYADAFHGKGTAYGETFDMYAYTAASRYLPYNTLVKVTNPKTGKAVIVRINDTGPWVKEGHKYYDKLNMDLSMAAFQVVSETGRGTLNATIERLGDAGLLVSEGIVPGPVTEAPAPVVVSTSPRSAAAERMLANRERRKLRRMAR